MSFTSLSILLAVGQPLFQFMFNRAMTKKLQKNALLAEFTCVHQIKGRRRYKSILLKDDLFSSTLKQKIESLNLVSTVTINTTTATMLITYACDETMVDELINHINAQTKKVNDARFEKSVSESTFTDSAVKACSAYGVGQTASYVGKRTVAGNLLKKHVTKANACVASSTNGIADLSIIIGAICLAWVLIRYIPKISFQMVLNLFGGAIKY